MLDSLISWTDATLNFWVGCTKVSTGDKGACEFCYAETWAKRWPAYQSTWGSGAPRVQFKHMLAKARAIEARGRKEGRRMFVFSNSLSDIFDNEVPISWLAEAIEIMRATPDNVYLLLTKRPQNILKRIKAAAELSQGPYTDDEGLRAYLPKNIAFGCTVVTQKEANRDVPWLLRAKAALRPLFVFLSMEPLMGPVDLTFLDIATPPGRTDDEVWGMNALTGQVAPILLLGAGERALDGGGQGGPKVDWVITGGESGPHAREEDPDNYRSIRDQCAAAGVPYQHKQMRKKGPIPPDLQIQQRPMVAA